MLIHYSNPSNITGGALKLNYTKTKDIFVWQDINDKYKSQVFLRPTRICAMTPMTKPAKKQIAVKYGAPLRISIFWTIAFRTLPIKIRPNHTLL